MKNCAHLRGRASAMPLPIISPPRVDAEMLLQNKTKRVLVLAQFSGVRRRSGAPPKLVASLRVRVNWPMMSLIDTRFSTFAV